MLQNQWSKKKSRQDPHCSQIFDNGHLHHLKSDSQKPTYPQIHNDVEKIIQKPTPSVIINEILFYAFNRKQTLITESTESNYQGTKGQINC